MKKNLMLFAAAAAAFGLLTVTGCEDNAGNEENNGEETTDISMFSASPTIISVWTENGMKVSKTVSEITLPNPP